MSFVSVVVPWADRWYFAELLRGATAAAADAGHSGVAHVIAPSETATIAATDAIVADFDGDDCVGAVIGGFRYRADQRDRALKFGRPVVVIGGSVMGFPTVMIDDIQAAATATDHLLQLGHRRITHFAGLLDQHIGFLVDQRRAKGYRLAMDRAGLQSTFIENPFDPDAVYVNARALLSGSPDQRPTAIFAVSDEIALSVLRAAQDLGIEPGRDLSIVGIDDRPDAATADLTTIRQRPDEIARTAVEMILAGVDHRTGSGESRLHAVNLVRRGSSNPPTRF